MSLPPCLGPCGRHSSPLLSLFLEREPVCPATSQPRPLKPGPRTKPPRLCRGETQAPPAALSLPSTAPAPGAGPAAAPLLLYLRCLPLKILPPACFAPLTVYPVLPLQVLLGAQTVPMLLLLPWTQSVLIPPGRAGPPLSTPFIPNPQTHRRTHTPQGLLPGAMASAFRPRGL